MVPEFANLIELLRQSRDVVAFSAVPKMNIARHVMLQPNFVFPAFPSFDCRYDPDHWIRPPTWTWVYHFPYAPPMPARRSAIYQTISLLSDSPPKEASLISHLVPDIYAFSLLPTCEVEPANLCRSRLQPMLSSTRCLATQRLSTISPPADPKGMKDCHALYISMLDPRDDQTNHIH